MKKKYYILLLLAFFYSCSKTDMSHHTTTTHDCIINQTIMEHIKTCEVISQDSNIIMDLCIHNSDTVITLFTFQCRYKDSINWYKGMTTIYNHNLYIFDKSNINKYASIYDSLSLKSSDISTLECTTDAMTYAEVFVLKKGKWMFTSCNKY